MEIYIWVLQFNLEGPPGKTGDHDLKLAELLLRWPKSLPPLDFISFHEPDLNWVVLAFGG